MSETRLPTLITETPQDGYALAVKLARTAVKLTQADPDIRTITMWWRDNRAWMAKADILRLESADPSVIAEQQLAQDGGKFVVFAGKIATSSQILPRPLRLSSLAPEAIYRIELLNRDQAPSLSRGDQLIKSAPLELSGAYLMDNGLTLPWSFPETMWVVKGTVL